MKFSKHHFVLITKYCCCPDIYISNSNGINRHTQYISLLRESNR